MHSERVHRVARRARVGLLRLGLLLTAAILPLSVATAQQVRQAPPSLLAKFDATAGTVQSLGLATAQQDGLQVEVVLGGAAYTISLLRHELRAPGFQLIERTASGDVLHPTPECVTYRGELLELPGSRVAASVVDGMMDGLVYVPPSGPGQLGQTWVVQSAHKVDPRANPSLHVVFRAADTAPMPYQCGTDTTGVTPPPVTGSPDYTAICEIAIEADRQFWQANNNSVTNTQNDITSVMNQVDFIYDRDCDVSYSIVTIIVTTTTVYTTNDATALLSQFSNYWSSNNTNISRDIAHLFTGRNLSGSTIGVAYLGTMCSQTNGFGLSQSRFSSNLNARTGLTAHELGHNFGSPHCNGNSPCYIMCSGLGGCSGNLTLFSPQVASQIDNTAHSLSCMPPPASAPSLTGANQSTVTVFSPGSVTLTGSGLFTVDSYTVGGQTFQSGFVVLGDTAVSVQMPNSTSFGPTTITVSNSLGTSNAVTVDYVVTQPPKLRSTVLIPPTGGIASYDFAGVPNNAWFLVLGIFPSTSPVQGFDLLANPLLLAFGTFGGPVGIENVSIPVPPGLGILQFYFQVLESTPTGQVTGVSNLTTTVLL